MSQRKTVTLDEDVVARLESETRRSGKSFEAVVNAALRAGLNIHAHEFVMKPHELGLRSGMEIDDIAGLIVRIEGDGHR